MQAKVKVPAILLKPVVVTRDNINMTVVKDGFQSLQSTNQGLSAGCRSIRADPYARYTLAVGQRKNPRSRGNLKENAASKAAKPLCGH